MEVEVQSTTIFAIGAHTEEVALRDARQLAKLFELSSYKLVSPLGFQEDLWHALNPGVSTPSIVKEFAQITTSTDFSAYVPCVHNDLGDSSGPLLALNISSARIGVVHHDVAKKSAADISGSFAAVGALGSGKSVLLKGIGRSLPRSRREDRRHRSHRGGGVRPMGRHHRRGCHRGSVSSQVEPGPTANLRARQGCRGCDISSTAASTASARRAARCPPRYCP